MTKSKTLRRKGARKEFLIEVVIKDHGTGREIPDFGLGNGVLRRQQTIFTDIAGLGFDSPAFAAALSQHGTDLINEAVEVRWTEKKKKKSRSRSKTCAASRSRTK